MVCCVLQKVFYEIKNWVKSRELVYGFVDLVCALVFECQLSENVWQVKILCVSSWKKL